MSNWTLSEIRTKTRQVSGRLSVSELSNNQIDDYINKYFQFEFPAEVKLNRNFTLHEFNTAANVEDYAFPADYTNFVPEASMDRRSIIFYQDPDKYFQENPQNITRLSTWTGDGATVAFTNTFTTQAPMVRGSVVVDDTVEVFSDDGAGAFVSNITGATSGTINYITGLVTVTFAVAPAVGQVIQVSFIQYIAGFPTAVLMFDNNFKFYPIPDRAYRFRIKAWSLLYVQPAIGATKTSFTLANDKPLQEEWGPAIAFGAARRIASDFGEMERYGELSMLYKEQINYILTRTHIDLESSRVLPQF